MDERDRAAHLTEGQTVLLRGARVHIVKRDGYAWRGEGYWQTLCGHSRPDERDFTLTGRAADCKSCLRAAGASSPPGTAPESAGNSPGAGGE